MLDRALVLAAVTAGVLVVAYLAVRPPTAALGRLATALQGSTDPWYDGNLARARARRLLSEHPGATCRPTG